MSTTIHPDSRELCEMEPDFRRAVHNGLAAVCLHCGAVADLSHWAMIIVGGETLHGSLRREAQASRPGDRPSTVALCPSCEDDFGARRATAWTVGLTRRWGIIYVPVQRFAPVMSALREWA